MRRVTGAAALLMALLFTLTLVNAAPQPPKGGYGNAGAITADELSTYLHFLASDQLEGRNTPSRGYDTASLYIASHLRQWGVKPLGSATGTKGPLQAYFMPIELVSNQPDPAGMKLTLTAPAAAGRGGAGGGVRRPARSSTAPNGCSAAEPAGPRRRPRGRSGHGPDRDRRRPARLRGQRLRHQQDRTPTPTRAST